jgi:hypothetical protein
LKEKTHLWAETVPSKRRQRGGREYKRERTCVCKDWHKKVPLIGGGYGKCIMSQPGH